MNRHKDEIKSALQRFGDGNLADNARNLLNTLGYRSERTLSLEPNTADGFVEHFDPQNTMNRERTRLSEWESIDFLFQLTDDEIIQSDQTTFHFEGSGVDQNRYESYLFFTLKLQNRDYTRTQLSEIIREINKLTPMPAMVVFQHGQTLTVVVIDRRLHKRDESKDVLEKVTLIKDINLGNPHRAHIDILCSTFLLVSYIVSIVSRISRGFIKRGKRRLTPRCSTSSFTKGCSTGLYGRSRSQNFP